MTTKTLHRNERDRDQADQTRAKILRAAILEFSAHGLAGARTDAIATAAKVNKALLYYYFKSKGGLYSAALQDVFGSVKERSLAVLESECSAGERLLRTALNHFDRILAQPEFQSLMEQEMVRFRRGESESLPLLVKTMFGPTLSRLQEVVREGIRTRELCKMDWLQVWNVALGANVFYFLSAPMMRMAVPFEPFNAATLKLRRKATVQFLGQALFSDRRRGAQLAKRVLADMPMPKIKRFSERRKTV